MRRAIGMLILGLSVQALADQPLSTSAELEREQNLEAAQARLAELKQVVQALEGEINRVHSTAVPPGKSGRAAGDEGKIVNGVRTSSFPTAGALIKGVVAADAESWCTGTLIGSRTFLTAAHCVDDDPRPDQYHVFFQHAGIFDATAITSHPDYQFPHADLAVVVLDQAVSGIEPTVLNAAPVPSGARGLIVGYGRAGGLEFDYGIKRAGTVTVAPCRRPETSLLCWDFTDPVGAAGLDSNTCNADSGGPLYIQPGGHDTPLILAGVTSGGSKSDCLSGDHSYDVDVRQFVGWITQTAPEGDVGPPGSTALPHWGSDLVSSPSATAELTFSNPQQTYTLPVSDQVEVLRVAINGHDEGSRDFDLFVNDDGAASAADNVCAQTGSGQYASCEFSDPSPGNWSIQVSAKQGSGKAQVTATLFEAAP